MELLTPDEIVRLSPPERLALIAQLWDSLEHEQLPLTAAWPHSITTDAMASRGLH
jgi:putative addiction module component (TIGR02574 family)